MAGLNAYFADRFGSTDDFDEEDSDAASDEYDEPHADEGAASGLADKPLSSSRPSMTILDGPQHDLEAVSDEEEMDSFDESFNDLADIPVSPVPISSSMLNDTAPTPVAVKDTPRKPRVVGRASPLRQSRVAELSGSPMPASPKDALESSSSSASSPSSPSSDFASSNLKRSSSSASRVSALSRSGTTARRAAEATINRIKHKLKMPAGEKESLYVPFVTAASGSTEVLGALPANTLEAFHAWSANRKLQPSKQTYERG